ncbi:carbohydrate ABC transporter permease [Pseudactinotalea sp. Z1739]|uniref:carbohydrate ABC transporter permease n=1 Tax=Pseudactinotalea sp. Z1739 TaxID=3413028 RepID=UPI003C7D43A0
MAQPVSAPPGRPGSEPGGPGGASRTRKGRSAPQRRPRSSWRKRAEIAFFTAPALALVAVFIAFPVAQAVRYSFYRWNGLGPLENWIGLENYARALSHSVFTDAVVNNLTIVVLSVLIQLPLGLGIALLLNRQMWGQSLLRVIIFIPYVLAEVVAGVVWFLLLQPRGMVNDLLETVGLGEWTQLWLADTEIALWTVMGVLTWKYLGLAVILMLAGLQGVPPELYEAAQIDGASWWKVQFKITIPLLGPTIRTWAFLSMIGSLQLFDMVWILTGGGPANATVTMAVYLIDQGTNRSLYGYASAVAVLLFAISLTLAALYQVFVLRRDTTDAPKPRRKKR